MNWQKGLQWGWMSSCTTKRVLTAVLQIMDAALSGDEIQSFWQDQRSCVTAKELKGFATTAQNCLRLHITCGLCGALIALWQSETIHPDRMRGLAIHLFYGKGKIFRSVTTGAVLHCHFQVTFKLPKFCSKGHLSTCTDELSRWIKNEQHEPSSMALGKLFLSYFVNCSQAVSSTLNKKYINKHLPAPWWAGADHQTSLKALLVP